MFQKEVITERERRYLSRLVKKQDIVSANISKPEGTSAYFADFSEEDNSSFEDQELVIVENSQQELVVPPNQTPPWLSVHLRNIIRRGIKKRTSGSVLAPMAAPITRLRYPSYRGKESEDPDSFIEEFEQIARANPDLATWEKLKHAFLSEFRVLGFHKTIYNQLVWLERKKKESLRTYTKRFRNLVNRLTCIPEVAQQVEWYVNGLSSSLALQCRLGPQNTMAEIIDTAERYESATQPGGRSKLKARQVESSSSEDESGTSSSDTSSDEWATSQTRRKKRVNCRRCPDEGTSSSEEDRSFPRNSSFDHRPVRTLLQEIAEVRLLIASIKENQGEPLHFHSRCQVCRFPGITQDDVRTLEGPSNRAIEELLRPGEISHEGETDQLIRISLSNLFPRPSLSRPGRGVDAVRPNSRQAVQGVSTLPESQMGEETLMWRETLGYLTLDCEGGNIAAVKSKVQHSRFISR
ncbi:hypothetical protein R1sor_023734 [Riccia sorocarpa]|uniref:Retrotransposon gag domain-containing protein n=1 Tax=Riccia sorocarpa TaxID=122646 RepID=A0ABD3GNH7_9MARC